MRRRSASAASALQGVASFGPLELDRHSPRYGHLLKTPKVGWSDIDIRGLVSRELGVPVGLDTDVNAAVRGEAMWGKGVDVGTLAYVTVGTGIGAGLIYHGHSLLGMTHTEIGHIHIRRHAKDQEFGGVCAFHGDCLEGLASGPAIQSRTRARMVRQRKRCRRVRLSTLRYPGSF
jgi:fructokinase